MLNAIGIRRETKDATQRRAPLSPDHIRELIRRYHTTVYVEPWSRRIFSDKEYRDAGARLTDDLSKANIIFGVKEIDPSLLLDRMTYCFFSHTVKGQAYNMPMLQSIIEKKITLCDYELVRGRDGKRLIFFGDFAGYAGMIDALWALGRRLEAEGIRSPFRKMRYASTYGCLREAREDLGEIADAIRKHGLPREITPCVCAFTGYGRVSTAAQELFDLLPTVEIEPEDLERVVRSGMNSDRVLYKVVLHKPHLFQHVTPGRGFDAHDFHDHPESYASRFEKYVPHLTMIINGIYWEPRFPRILTKKYMKALYARVRHPRLRVIGDITCDIDGSIELTVKETDATNPVYVYDPVSGRLRDGWKGRGPVILAVDKLPAELPREASESFGTALLPFVRQLAHAEFSRPMSTLLLAEELKHAVIVHRGRLRPAYAHLRALVE